MRSKDKNKWLYIGCYLIILYSLVFASNSYGQVETTPLQFLKKQEMRHKDIKGEIYLGRVMTITYPIYDVDADEKYHPILLELTDVLKSPLRENYRLVLKGYSDSRGPALENMKLSVKRAENLKGLLIKKYYMKEIRITTQGLGEIEPVASNKTEEGRGLNRRVEVHIYGNVSEAVRFIEKQEE